MPTCPECGNQMVVAEEISVAGVQNKAVRWRCADHEIEVVAAHPVQMPHLHIGDEDERDGRRTQIVKLEMIGAELMVFRQLLRP
jgi:hypothetical protein